MKRSLFWAAVEAAAKATRSGLSVVGALVDCGIPRQHAGAQWLTEFEEENECLEVPLSADFTDEPSGRCPNAGLMCNCTGACRPTPAQVQAGLRGVQINPNLRLPFPQGSRTNAGATCNRAVEETSEGASPPAAPSDVLGPTVEELQGTCLAFLAAHEYRKFYGSLYGECSCGVEFGSVGQWREHVTELQASALRSAIQEARNTPPIPFPCVVDDCTETFTAYEDLNTHSYWMHLQDDPFKVSTDPLVKYMRYPGATDGGDFTWKHLTVTSSKAQK